MNMINRKQLYTNQLKMEESKQNETFYCYRL